MKGMDAPAKLGPTSWHDFLGNAVSASSIGEHWFCAAKVLNTATYGNVETEETKAGSDYHEERAIEAIKKLGPLKKVKIETLDDVIKLSRDNIARALARRQVLANGEETVLFWAVSPELRFVGVPDKVDCTNGKEPIVMDFKTTGRLPSDAWTDHRVQVGAYMIGVANLGFKQSYGIIRYSLRDTPSETADYKVYFDEYLKRQVAETAQTVHDILDGSEPRPTTNSNKCRSCAYNQVCKWSLVRGTP